MAGEILLAAVALVAATQEPLNLGAVCDRLPPGTSITFGHHRVTRAEDGACTIENTNASTPAPSQQRGERT